MGKKRRGRDEGGIYYREDTGRWEGRASFIDGEGKRRRPTVTGDSKKEVLDKLDELKKRVREGACHTEANKTRLRDYLDSWLEKCKTTTSPNTFLQYEQHVRLYLRGLAGALYLGKVNSAHVEDLLVKLHAQGHPKGLQRRVVRTLSAALGSAVETGIIPVNPCRKVKKPKIDRAEEVKAYTREQVAALLRAVWDRGDRLWALYVLSIDSGMRQEEVFALEWRDIDLGAGTVRVSKALEEVSLRMREVIGDLHESEGRFRVKSIKTKKGKRTLPLAPQTLDALRLHRERMDQEGHGSPLVFPDTRGGYLRKSNFRTRSLEPALRAAGLPSYGSHGFRHTCATLLLQDGVHVKVVSERLGHATVTLTLETYATILPGMQETAALKMGHLLGGALGNMLGGSGGGPEAPLSLQPPIGHGQATEDPGTPVSRVDAPAVKPYS